jgi:hypothetical protein
VCRVPTLVARDRELAALDGLLESGEPKLALLQGEDGAGKSSMLRAVEDLARQRGWAAVRSRDDRSLRIGASTTERDLLFEVERLIETPVAHTATVASATLRRRKSAAPHPLVVRLAEEAPVAVLIDGYRPSAELARWWTTEVIPGLREEGCPVLVAVADRDEPLAPLVPLADLVIELGPLDRTALAHFLRAVGDGLAPPLSEEELDAYVDATSAAPGQLSPLLAALELAKAPEAVEVTT